MESFYSRDVLTVNSNPDCSKINFVLHHPMRSTVLPDPASKNVGFTFLPARFTGCKSHCKFHWLQVSRAARFTV